MPEDLLCDEERKDKEAVAESFCIWGSSLIDMQQKFAGILEKTCGMEAGAFEAIVLGDKTNLDPELKMRYQMAGIIHILAISGLLVSVFLEWDCIIC